MSDGIRSSLQHTLPLPFRFVWWTVTLRLPERMRLRAQKKFVLESGLFDTEFYLQHNRDVAEAGMDPVEHYLAMPGGRSRNPHPLFDTNWYLAQNPDVARAELNPLLHYLQAGWKEHRNPHPLFDVEFYLKQNPNVERAGVEPLGHYLRSGAFDGRDPHPLFDSTFYLSESPEVAAAHLNPLMHYVTWGWREGRNPNPFFDVTFYLKRYADVAQAGADPLQHYLASGAAEKRDPHPFFDSNFYLQRNPEIEELGINPLMHYLRDNGNDPNPYFDAVYYSEQNANVPRTAVAAARHYLQHGATQGCNPHPLFDTNWYVSKNPEVVATGENPLLHFLRRGRHDRRDPHPVFDSTFYLERNPDLLADGPPPSDHYLRCGGLEGCDPHPLFDSDWYLAQLPNAARSGENPLLHYLRCGWKEKRSPCPFFDGAFYLERNPDVAQGKISSLHHYLIRGAAEGRDPSRFFDTDWYVAQNPEIVAAGWNPLVHYVRVGVEEGRRPRPLSKTHTRARMKSSGRPRIVFVSGEPQSSGHQYRIVNMAGSLAPQFFETVIMNSSEVAQRIGEIAEADLVWMWRTGLTAETAELVAALREAGAAIVFDVKDPMVRPEKAMQLMLLEADRCTVPTIRLARELREFRRPVTVVPDGFDERTRQCARAAMRARRSEPDDGLIRIGYFSRPVSDQRDLQVAAPALAAVLREHESARLMLFREKTGITQFPELDKVQDRIEWLNGAATKNPWRDYARLDINIAPVEPGNRHSEMRSELNFFEAALAGVPTVVSPTQPFMDAMRHGETGLLATNTDEWYECLKRLLRDRELRRSMAERAYQDVLWLYGPERRSLLVTRLVNELLAPAPLRFDMFRSEMQSDSAGTMPSIAVPPYDVFYQSGRRGTSRISVVIPLFNYADLVEEALESVRQQTVHDIDVIVVDDRSTDKSAAVAHRWLAQHAPHFNFVALLRNRQNSGLGKTRNAGVHFSDTEVYMALDADNALLPDCLEKCMAKLHETGAAFAYPTISLFGDRTGQIGLMDYDPALLANANYIDAMAMVRKACWVAVGGYSALEPMGWEDYDFWCKLAEKGLFGVRVEDTAARYRTHGESMLKTITEIAENKPKVVEELNRRHPWLQLGVEQSRKI